MWLSYYPRCVLLVKGVIRQSQKKKLSKVCVCVCFHVMYGDLLCGFLFLFSSQSFRFSQQTQKKKTTAESSKKALVLQIAH